MSRSARPMLGGTFSAPRASQGVPLKPVPMSGMSGQPQGPMWSIADAIMAQHAEPDVVDRVGEVENIADWDEWNTPRYDVERFYTAEHARHTDTARAAYLNKSLDDHLTIREYVRLCMCEFNAIGAGSAVRGVVTPMTTFQEPDADEQPRPRKKRKRRT